MKFLIGMSLFMFLMIGAHFATVWGLFGNAPEARAGFFVRIGVIIAIFIVASGVVAGTIAARRGEQAIEPDERERLILTKTERNGGYAVSAGVLGLMWFAFDDMSAMDIANAGLGILAFGEAVKIVSGLFYIRQGS